MKEKNEDLLGELARRNWLILAVLVLGSLAWRSMPVTLGVLSGGLVAIVGYQWLFRSLRRMLAHPSRGAAKSFQFGYFIRLGALGAALFVLIALVRVNPIGLAVGLSVVVINIGWTTIKRSI
ncbi:hypothetical protein DESUT3_40000 [Desulfuromonas versatilis]|uniref:ATP synthase subunit I n=1 Tax=Desulfuromonas versatilis TaxID=2802975 RepID=A0ABM8I2Y3_9BACT|nr:ATP synthase subunit I [Desulfuromonas versatilis]BCR06931.1 hypothetical protein DESUT3_40000 [Desulfuromonas versatilis]